MGGTTKVLSSAADPIAGAKHRIQLRREMTRNADKRGLVGLCRNAYRDDQGNVKCGVACCGEGYVFKKPFEEDCAQWKPREEIQPMVGKTPEQNEAFARKVRLLTLASKGIVVNPVGLL